MTEDVTLACGHGILTIQERSGQLRWIQADGVVTEEPVNDASRLAFCGYDLDLWAEDCRHCCPNLRIVHGDPSRRGFVGIVERSQDRPDAIEYRFILSKPGHSPAYVPRDGEQADSYEEEQAVVIWMMLESLAEKSPI